MKKIFKYLILAFAAGTALGSCSVNEETVGQAREIRFTTSLGTFKVKATDTAFEKGDAVGVNVSEPVSITNAKLVFENGGLKGSQPIYWGPSQAENEQSVFTAYYPYVEDANISEGIEFTVKADQSTHELYTASDLMTAMAVASPGDGAVHLDFVHRLSKIVITIDNKIGEEIKDVYFADVYGRGTFKSDVYQYSHIGETGTIKAGKVTKADGSAAWALIIVPQYTSPRLLVTTVSDKQYSYDLEARVAFNPGRQYNASIEINEQTVVSDLTSDIIDWTDDTDLQFGQHGGQQGAFNELCITGDLMGLGWTDDIVMEYIDNANLYYSVIYCKEGESFKFRGDHAWDVDFGNGPVSSGKWYPGEKAGQNITITDGGGLYDVIFNPSDNSFVVAPLGSFYNWGLIGSFNNWDGDVSMSSVGAIGGVYPAFGYEVTLDTNAEFKFRANGAWDFDYGLDWDYNGTEMVEGQWYPAQKTGANFRIGEGGTFRIIFDICRRLVGISRLQDSPKISTVQEVVEGADSLTYTVRGIVTSIVNTSYGNYYISDEYGNTLYIYGTKDSDGNYPRSIDGGLETMGVILGNTITVTGLKTTYHNTPELVDVIVVDVQQGPINLYSGSASLSADGGETRIPFYAVSQPEIGLTGDMASWVSYSIESSGNNYYSLVLTYSANTSGSQAIGVVSLTCQNVTLAVQLTQDVYIESLNVAALIGLANNYVFTELNGQVIELGSRGFIFSDGTANVLVYCGTGGAAYSDGTPVKIGDHIALSGTKTIYYGLAEIAGNASYQALSYTFVKTGTVPAVEYTDITSDFDNFTAESAVPIKFKGVLSKSGNYYNVAVEGATKIGAVYWPASEFGLDQLDGKTIEVCGYYGGVSGNYKYIHTTEVKTVS